jgi:insulysin
MIQSIDLKSFQRFQINKSIYDKREYRGLLLNNELRCLLISDSSTAKSAASMDVHVGTIHEPKHLPGLAHFCEQLVVILLYNDKFN